MATPQQKADATVISQQWLDRAYSTLSALPPNVLMERAQTIQRTVYQRILAEMEGGATTEQAIAVGNSAGASLIQGYAQEAGITVNADSLPGATASGATTSISPEDTNNALDVFRQGVEPGGQPFEGIVSADPTVITAPGIAPTTISEADRLRAALQRETAVQGTTMDESQQAAARLLQLRNIQELEAQARGGGAVQQAAEARQKLALLRGAQQSTGLIQQARGAERRGLRRAELFQRGERQVATQLGLEEQAATQAQQAQQALQTATTAVRTTDVDVAQKQADFEARRKELQAQLDQARAQGDQQAVNDIAKKQADLDQEVAKFNAQQTQQAQTREAELDVDAQKATGEAQRDQDRLRLEAVDARNKAASGLLSEQARQDALQMARRQLALAEAEFEEAKRRNAAQEELARRQQNIQFWGGIISGLLTTATALAVPGAKHGGITSGVTIAGEAGPEIVIPIKGKLSAALMRKFAVDKEPFKDRPIPAKKLASLLAAANVSERRQKGM